ncbi:hypothetical protein BN1723_012404 [Verticillium longisporum]|uniref:Uncharacterized protein n=1 Tax=Verticillium longisporum TaxID=100787 RepID=A0A0G4LHF7_VERLO|nr:hypothetical protein HYQ44_003197 [Verticillium longisporum]CRK21461.1 hypothetical protein BN1723_012404 [Verticillium longisporum]
MKLSWITLVAAQLLAVVALPTSHDRGSALVSRGGRTADAGEAGAGAETGASEPAAGGEAGGENKANEVEQQAQFDTPIAVGGDDIKTDTLYPPGVNGVFEVELQGPVGRTLTVTENKSPAAPPIGFIAVEPVSWIISLAEGTDGLTLQKVDYILNANNTLDISKGQAARLCTETNAFVIGPAVGELEFEREENELTVTVDNINGEFAFFIPDHAAVAAPPAVPSPPAGTATPAAPAAGEALSGQALVDAILAHLSGPA